MRNRVFWETKRKEEIQLSMSFHFCEWPISSLSPTLGASLGVKSKESKEVVMLGGIIVPRSPPMSYPARRSYKTAKVVAVFLNMRRPKHYMAAPSVKTPHRKGHD